MSIILTVLFAFIGKMTFTLACVSACLYSAGSQVLSLDRTVGGRMFSAVVFTGCMLSSGVLGGALSTLAWLARGDARGLLEYLPDAFQKIPSRFDLGLLLKWIPKLAAIPLPEFVREELKKLQDDAFQLTDSNVIPEVDSAFWILLMILPVIIFIPFSIARANKDFRLGILMAIATLFMGSQIVFASLLPTLGLHLYWTQVPAGYIKVALVNAGAMLVTGLLFLSTSSHDAVRCKLGALLEGTGALLSHSASIVALKTTEKPLSVGSDLGLSTDPIVKEMVFKEVDASAKKDALLSDKIGPSTPLDEESQHSMHTWPTAVKTALDLQGDAHAVTEQIAVVSMILFSILLLHANLEELNMFF